MNNEVKMNSGERVRIKSARKVQKNRLFHLKQAVFVARRREFESLTFWSVARRSIQLS